MLQRQNTQQPMNVYLYIWIVQDEIKIDMDDFIKTPFKDIRLSDYKKSKKRMDELREMTGISEFPEFDK